MVNRTSPLVCGLYYLYLIGDEQKLFQTFKWRDYEPYRVMNRILYERRKESPCIYSVGALIDNKHIFLEELLNGK